MGVHTKPSSLSEHTAPGLLTWPLLVAMVTMLTLGGCSRQAIRRQADVQRTMLTAPLPTASPLVVNNKGPFQATLHLGEALLERLAYTALAPRLNGAAQISEIDAIPYLRVDAIRVSLPTCDRCIAIDLDLEMGVNPAGEGLLGTLIAEAAEHIRTEGRLSMEGRLSITNEANQPGLTINDLQVTGVKLTGAVEASVALPRQLVEAGMRKVVDEALSQQTTAPTIPLPLQAMVGTQPLKLTALAVKTVRANPGSPGGQVVLGVNTQVSAKSQTPIAFATDVGSREWGLTISTSLVEAVIRRSLAPAGGALSRGPFDELRGLSTDNEGLAATVRMWKGGWFPYSQDYALSWTPSIDEGQPVAQNVAMSRGAGQGATRRAPKGDEALAVGERVLAQTQALSMGATNWPASASLEARASLVGIHTSSEAITLVGDLVFGGAETH